MSDHPRLGRVLTAMVSPMRPDGAIDLSATGELATYLVDQGNDGLVVSGTTGESATTTDDEKHAILEVVLAAVGHRAVVIAGVGSNDTAHTVQLARESARRGAHGLLAVTPYYNKPPQEGVARHFEAVADATDLPVVVYDIPGRTGIPIAKTTLLRLAEHPRIVAVKDAKGDLWEATSVMSTTDLQWYSGDDVANLAHLTNGAVGIISVVAHVAARQYADLVAAIDKSDLPEALAIHRRLVPVVDAIMHTSQGAITAKAALVERGVIEHATCRLPLVESPPEHLDRIRAGLAALDDA